MAKNTLSEKKRRELAALGRSDGAKSYGEWLGAQVESDGMARLSAAAEQEREAVGYGATAERLSAGGLSDDGYAAYLRRAAREARSAREAALDAERESRDLAALRGYAEYLEAERTASGERLVALGEELVSSPMSYDEAARRIALARVSPRAAAALRTAHRYEGSREEAPAATISEAKVLDYLKRVTLPYSRAYQYCLSLGFTEEESARLAKEAAAAYSEETKRLHALFEK